MKHFSLLIFICVCSGHLLLAQTTKTPQLINFQAVAVNSQGNPLANSFVLTRVTVRQGGPNGTAYYCALHTLPTDDYGTFSFKMNQNADGVNCNGATNPNFDEIPWDLGIFWLTVEYSYNSGQDYTTIDPIELASVPYALFAAKLENVKTTDALNGQVLKFNGIKQQFEPANDETAGFSLYEGAGINVTQTPGDPNIGVALADNGVTSGKIEDSAVTKSKIAPGSVSSDKLSIPAANGQVLKFNNGTWAAGTDEIGQGSTVVTITGAGSGITVNNLGNNIFTVQNTGDTNGGDDITTSSDAGGDVAGKFNNLQIAPNTISTTEIVDGSITPLKMNGMGAVNGQVLKYVNGAWGPAIDETGPGGSNVNIVGVNPGISVTNNGNNSFSLQNTGDVNAFDDIIASTSASGDVSGTFSNLQINANAVTSTEISTGAVTTAKIADAAVTPVKINAMGASSGQVLKYNNGAWGPANDETGSGSNTNIVGVSPGIVVTNNGINSYSIQNTGDLNGADDITTSSVAGGDINGVFSNLQITSNAVSTNEIAAGAITATKINSMGASNGQILKYSNGTWGPGTDNGGASVWNTLGNDINNSNTGNVGIGTSSPLTKLDVQGQASTDVISATYTGSTVSDYVAVHGISNPGDFYGIGGKFEGGYKGVIGQVNPTGNSGYTGVQGQVSGGTGRNYGISGIASGNGNNYGVFGSASGGIQNYAGYFDGKLGTTNLLINDFDDITKVNLLSSSNSVGRGTFYGQNGLANIYLGSVFYSGVEYPNNGFVSVFDEYGDIKAGMVVNQNGQGDLFADIKNFRMNHPTDPTKEIWYASIEGPEAGAYVRGTGQIVNGEAFILFPDHFSIVANPSTLTVILTPGSSETFGLSVVEKLPNGFKVKELKGGKGTFSFDWEAKAIRKGFENYQAVRNKRDTPNAPSTINVSTPTKLRKDKKEIKKTNPILKNK